MSQTNTPEIERIKAAAGNLSNWRLVSRPSLYENVLSEAAERKQASPSATQRLSRVSEAATKAYASFSDAEQEELEIVLLKAMSADHVWMARNLGLLCGVPTKLLDQLETLAKLGVQLR